MIKQHTGLKNGIHSIKGWTKQFNLNIENAKDLCIMAIGDKVEISFKKLNENSKISFKGTQENEKENNTQIKNFSEDITLITNELDPTIDDPIEDIFYTDEQLTNEIDANLQEAFMEETVDDTYHKERIKQLAGQFTAKSTTRYKDDPDVPEWIPVKPTCAIRVHVPQVIDESYNYITNYYLETIENILEKVKLNLDEDFGIKPGQHMSLSWNGTELMDGNQVCSPYDLGMGYMVDLILSWQVDMELE